MSEQVSKALSVRDIVRQRTGADPDAWRLALVQRDKVWDDVRMRYLLDSLLNGYPIGSLLVCRATGQRHVMTFEDRKTVVADDGTWQLLDGQQRVNGLYSIFTALAGYGHFYMLMTERIPEPQGPVTGRRARDQGLKYIHWQEAKKPRSQQENEAGGQEEEADAVPDREQRVDLSRWYEWAERDGGASLTRATSSLDASADGVVGLLNELDPDFTNELNNSHKEIARDLLRRLIGVWQTPATLVQYLSLGSPLHLLEVFTRVNRAGVQVAGQDLFFAAVKTLWNDAEEILAKIEDRLTPVVDGNVERDRLVDRMGVLRLAGRLAARAVGQADLVPLAVDRLSGERGTAVIAAMRQLSVPDSKAILRMAALVKVLMTQSGLGFGLYSVDHRLWDDVLAWAAVNPRAEDSRWLVQKLHAVDSYLLGATAFQYPSVLGDRYARLAMTEALVAGVAGEAFPVESIIEATRGTFVSLEAGRQQVCDLGDDLEWVADTNAGLFLSIVQQIPYIPQRDEFDWDHIYAQGQASKMWSPGDGGRRCHHEFRRFVGSAGNLWGLDAGLNRALGDKMPRAKFDQIKKWADEDKSGLKDKSGLWPRDQWWLSADDIAEFTSVGDALEDGTKVAVGRAMKRFHSLVTARARRLVDEVFNKFPTARLFASDAVGPATSVREEVDIAAALGITVPATKPEPGKGSTDDNQRLANVLRLARDYGVARELSDLIGTARDLGLYIHPYASSVMIAPPQHGGMMLVTVWPKAAEGGSFWIERSPSQFHDFFPEISEERAREAIGAEGGGVLSRAELVATMAKLRQLFVGVVVQRRED